MFPRNQLKKQWLPRGRYHQIANFVVAQSAINISTGDAAPEGYFAHLREQVRGGEKRYGGRSVLRSSRCARQLMWPS